MFYEFIFILCYMINSNKNVSTVIFILVIIYILLNLFTNYLSNIISFMYYNITNKNYKMGEVLNVNNYYISFFYIISIFMIALAKALKLDYVFEKILSPILLLIQKFLQVVLGGLLNHIGIDKVKKVKIKTIIAYYKKSDNSIDEVEYLENENKSSVLSYLFNFNHKKFDNTNNGKIRKIYYKKILKIKKHIPVFNDKLTPEEIEKQINIKR